MSDWFGLRLNLGNPRAGTFFLSLPLGSKTIVSDGRRYYRRDNVYYKPCNSGYIVVAEPEVAREVVYLPRASGESRRTTMDEIVINVPNRNGSYTKVALVKVDDGYIGPQGEYYPNHPTVEQLKVLYGR